MSMQSQAGHSDGEHAFPPKGERQHPLVPVVNDTQEILDLFREILEEEGYDVALSSYGSQEVAGIQEIDPDLVILDFIMGGEEQGWQLLQKIRMNRETRDLPIIVCTGAIRLAKELEGHLTTKGVGLVLKSFDIDDLLVEVGKFLSRFVKSDQANGMPTTGT
jgi:DNA-binding response OmpR family regulator